jgi:hypothetical protein
VIRRTLFSVFAVLLTFIAWVTTVVAPAAIADTHDRLLVSSDGTTWAADLGRPLFDPADLWVPGESRTSTFYVRNGGRTPASVRMAVLEPPGGLSGEVALQARVEDEPWHPVSGELDADALNVVAAPASSARRVDVRAVFRGAARNATQASEVALRFVVQLAQAPPVSRDGLPATGAPDLRLPLLLAAAALAVGAALVRRPREVGARG